MHLNPTLRTRPRAPCAPLRLKKHRSCFLCSRCAAALPLLRFPEMRFVFTAAIFGTRPAQELDVVFCPAHARASYRLRRLSCRRAIISERPDGRRLAERSAAVCFGLRPPRSDRPGKGALMALPGSIKCETDLRYLLCSDVARSATPNPRRPRSPASVTARSGLKSSRVALASLATLPTSRRRRRT